MTKKHNRTKKRSKRLLPQILDNHGRLSDTSRTKPTFTSWRYRSTRLRQKSPRRAIVFPVDENSCNNTSQRHCIRLEDAEGGNVPPTVTPWRSQMSQDGSGRHAESVHIDDDEDNVDDAIPEEVHHQVCDLGAGGKMLDSPRSEVEPGRRDQPNLNLAHNLRTGGKLGGHLLDDLILYTHDDAEVTGAQHNSFYSPAKTVDSVQDLSADREVHSDAIVGQQLIDAIGNMSTPMISVDCLPGSVVASSKGNQPVLVADADAHTLALADAPDSSDIATQTPSRNFILSFGAGGGSSDCKRVARELNNEFCSDSEDEEEDMAFPILSTRSGLGGDSEGHTDHGTFLDLNFATVRIPVSELTQHLEGPWIEYRHLFEVNSSPDAKSRHMNPGKRSGVDNTVIGDRSHLTTEQLGSSPEPKKTSTPAKELQALLEDREALENRGDVPPSRGGYPQRCANVNCRDSGKGEDGLPVLQMRVGMVYLVANKGFTRANDIPMTYWERSDTLSAQEFSKLIQTRLTRQWHHEIEQNLQVITASRKVNETKTTTDAGKHFPKTGRANLQANLDNVQSLMELIRPGRAGQGNTTDRYQDFRRRAIEQAGLLNEGLPKQILDPRQFVWDTTRSEAEVEKESDAILRQVTRGMFSTLRKHARSALAMDAVEDFGGNPQAKICEPCVDHYLQTFRVRSTVCCLCNKPLVLTQSFSTTVQEIDELMADLPDVLRPKSEEDHLMGPSMIQRFFSNCNVLLYGMPDSPHNFSVVLCGQIGCAEACHAWCYYVAQFKDKTESAVMRMASRTAASAPQLRSPSGTSSSAEAQVPRQTRSTQATSQTQSTPFTPYSSSTSPAAPALNDSSPAMEVRFKENLRIALPTFECAYHHGLRVAQDMQYRYMDIRAKQRHGQRSFLKFKQNLQSSDYSPHRRMYISRSNAYEAWPACRTYLQLDDGGDLRQGVDLDKIHTHSLHRPWKSLKFQGLQRPDQVLKVIYRALETMTGQKGLTTTWLQNRDNRKHQIQLQERKRKASQD
eukprot:Clim_evm24s241 gene=Clim_evmTU24s241